MSSVRETMVFYTVWLVLALGYVLNMTYNWFIPEVNWVFKPLPVVLLALWVWRKTPDDALQHKPWIILALLCSAVGDVMLLMEDRFLYGLLAFLLAHLFYLRIFAQASSMAHIRWLVVMVIICGLLLGGYLLLPSVTGQLQIAVVSYMSVIGLMAIFAVLCKRVHWVAIPGVLTFLFSDLLLGYHIFVSPVAWGDQGIMGSYYAAQFLLAHSVVWYKEPLEDPFAVA